MRNMSTRAWKKIWMKTRKLGNSDLEITSVGFGAWAIGGGGWEFSWGAQDDRVSVEAIHRALEMGVNWIDTAPAYGCGHSEEVVARAVAEWSGTPPYLFTKCGLAWDEKGKIERELTPESIRRECESSLRRLGTETIHLYQVHWPPLDDEQLEPAWETMASLQREGKVRWIGVSNFDVPQMERCLSIASITSLQPAYSLLFREIESEILPYCHRMGIGVIVYSPMASGLLSGSMTRDRIAGFPEDDWRRRSDEFKDPKLRRNLQMAERLKKAGLRRQRSAGEVAIAWTLMHPAVTGAIVGVRSPKQVDGVMRAAEFELADEEAEEIENTV
jgi:aryl-alcohol dehydrogenase-like predicted oxidoreductase